MDSGVDIGAIAATTETGIGKSIGGSVGEG